MADNKGTHVGPLIAGLLIAVAGWLLLGPLIGVAAGFGTAVLLLLARIAQKGS